MTWCLSLSIRKGGWSAGNASLKDLVRTVLSMRQIPALTDADQSSLLSACLSIEFGYAVIYSLSPVGYVTVPENIKATSNVQSLRHETIQAARNLLSLVSGALDSSGMLQYIPVRCWVFAMAASLHLLKVSLGLLTRGLLMGWADSELHRKHSVTSPMSQIKTRIYSYSEEPLKLCVAVLQMMSILQVDTRNLLAFCWMQC